MSTKTKVVVALLAIVLLGGAAYLLVSRGGTQAPVTVTLRVSVAPTEQSGFVAGQANSARFKYLVGKLAGVKPVLAQKLSVKPISNSPLLEAQVGVTTKDEGQRFVAGFVETLELLCRGQARVTLIEQSIR